MLQAISTKRAIMTKVFVVQFTAFLLSIIILSPLHAKGLDIQVPGAHVAPQVSLEAMADSMQEYVNIRSMIQREQKKRIQGQDLLRLKIQFKEQSTKVKDLADNCAELTDDSRHNILQAIKEDERYYEHVR
jgi:hypothetical protein